MTQRSLIASKPPTVVLRTASVDVQQLFRALGKALVHATVQNWTAFAMSTVDALAAVRAKPDAGALAHLLIRRAVTRAVFDLLEDQLRVLAPRAEVLADFDVSEAIDDAEVPMDRSFFERPDALPFAQAVQQCLVTWLVRLEVAPADAAVLAERLPSYLVFALANEWRSRARVYQPLHDALDGPFGRAAEREVAWWRYRAWLRRQVDRRMFDEVFGLRQVYIEPRASFLPQSAGPLRSFDEGPVPQSRRVLALLPELRKWVARPSSRDAIRVISGGPGAGKSSVAKMLVAELAARGAPRVLFVPLRHFELSGDLVRSVGAFVANDGFLAENPLDPHNRPGHLLLVFDGLDELASRGRSSAGVARDFVHELQLRVAQFNQRPDVIVQALLIGRELIVQASATDFRRPKQILELLPYRVSPEGAGQLDDPDILLEVDQRDAWWSRFGSAVGTDFDRMPQALRRPKLDELTAQPLLNYLVALSYCRGNLDFEGQPNLNEVYADLVDQVYRRGWEPSQHPALDAFKNPDDFARILEQVALAAWHGNSRTTSVAEIERRCEGRLGKLLGALQVGAQEGVIQLLTAFYFRQRGRGPDGERAFEFTHKSFGEYLAARRLVRAIHTMHEEHARYLGDSDTGWSEQHALTVWAQLCGPAPMDAYLFSFLVDEVRLCDVEQVRRWQKTLERVLNAMFRQGMPMEGLNPRPSFRSEWKQARNASESLFAALSACSRTTRARSVLRFPNTTLFGEWLRFAQGQRKGPGNRLVSSCLSRLDLSEQCLNTADLYKADLSHTDLRGAQLVNATLRGADLRNAVLRGANLYKANLDGADLAGADLRGAMIEDASFGPPVNLGTALLAPQKGAVGDRRAFERAAPAQQLRMMGARVYPSKRGL